LVKTLVPPIARTPVNGIRPRAELIAAPLPGLSEVIWPAVSSRLRLGRGSLGAGADRAGRPECG
jgi:hypothetical protein